MVFGTQTLLVLSDIDLLLVGVCIVAVLHAVLLAMDYGCLCL